MKKTLVSVAATAVLSTAFAASASANTHKVESGDSLWSIAIKYDTSVSAIKELNKLRSELIFPNQLLKVDTVSLDQPVKPSSNQTSNPSVSAQKYTVKSGDTLSAIAYKYSITVSELQKWNSINGHLIFPGQVLNIASGTSSSDQSNGNVTSPAPPSTPSKPESSNTYSVKAGDTLSYISRMYDVSVQDIKRLNNLSSDLIYIGQTIKIGKSQVSQPSSTTETVQSNEGSDTSFNTNTLISHAKAQLGIPYSWGGSTPSGFDCSGFIYYAFNKSGVKVSRTSSEGYYSRSYYVNQPSIGDLVFFENTYKKGISHLGIYVGDNKFIHAGDNGVEITSLDNSYWKSKFDGFKRFYDL
ncbi:LysM peptidoglycan-binding domain-containing protein [Rossellomorea vietnamensis]|uniref:LysM peptidoglycan-binding domain-containing protein n=1 Tax=Rossellomorea vietnamensis TaxID=218284 RepID=A0A6I6UWY0_9BACI|nr:LysM peptidoglycan-binding domain-containing protein [Rossellomorea vietnamensis]QHE63380.1 LysM peptidoglycan-binding domain-containing protein [Rossellomorea vietnamensis]